MALTDLTRISTSGIATGTSLSGAILHGDAHFRGDQVGINSAIFDSSANELNFKDNVKLTFGDKTNGDLQLYHGGSHSFIKDTGTGNLQIQSNRTIINNAANTEVLSKFIENIGVELYDGADTVRLATNGSGAVVTGILTATGSFSGQTYNTAGIATFYNLRVSNDLTVEGTTTTLDTNLVGVDRIEVGANSNSIVGVAITQSGTADIINLYDGATEVLTVTDGGKVGIGLTNPSGKLHVGGISSGDIVAELDSGSPTFTYRNGSGAWFHAGKHPTKDAFVIADGANTTTNERLLINNIGITSVQGQDDQDNFIVNVNGTEFAVHTDASDGEISLRAQDKDGSTNSKYMTFYTQASGSTTAERLRIDSSGRLVVGHTAAIGDLHGPQGTTNRNPFIQIHGANTASAGAALISWKNSAGAYYAPTLFLAHSGSDTKGTNAVIPANGEFGSIVFSGDDGTDFVKGAMIKARLDGTPGDNDMPGRLSFYTTPDGAQEPEERLRIGSNGYVNIGTGTAQQQLTVQNSAQHSLVRVISSPTAESGIDFGDTDDGDQGKVRYNNVGSFMKFEVGGNSEKLRILSDGKVGVGVTNPDSNVEIDRGSEGKYLTIGGDDANNGRGLSFTSSTDNTGSNGALHTINAKSGNGAIALATASSEALRINNYGALLIGLTAPTYGAGDMRHEIKKNNSRTYTAPLMVSHSHLLLNNSDTSTSTFCGIGIRAGSGDGAIGFVYGNAANSADFVISTDGGSNGAERFRIRNDGKVGIGVTNPDSKLHVHNGSAGSVTASSAASLTIESSASDYNVLQFLSPATANQQIRFGDPADNGAGWIQYSHSANALIFGTYGPEKMRIDSSGRVGINTNDPAAPLHVQKKGGTIAIFGNDDGSSGTQYECLVITNGTQSYPAISNDSSSDTLELRSAGSVQATIDYNNNDTNKHFRVMANAAGGGGSEVFRVDEEGQISGISPGDNHTGVINNCDVALGAQYTWNQLESSNNVTNSASNHFKIAFYRSTSGNYTTCYYRGVVVDVFASGKLDWGGHGFVTHYSKSLLTMSSTTTGRYHDLGINKGYSYLQNNASNMTLDTVDWSHDSDYLYATFKFQTDQGGSGWNPYYTVTITDNTGIVQSVTGI